MEAYVAGPEGEWKSRRSEVREGATRGHPEPPSRGILCIIKHSLGMYVFNSHKWQYINSLCFVPNFFLLYSIP